MRQLLLPELTLRTGHFGSIFSENNGIGIGAGASRCVLGCRRAGTFISPSISVTTAFRKIGIRFEKLFIPYKSVYETTLGGIPRLTNKFWSIGLTFMPAGRKKYSY